MYLKIQIFLWESNYIKLAFLKLLLIFLFIQENLTHNDIVQSLQLLNLISDVTKAVLSENIETTWDRLSKLKKLFPVKCINN